MVWPFDWFYDIFHLGVVEERREDLVFGTFVRAALLSRRRSFRRFFFFSSLFSSSFIKSRRSLSLVLSIVAGRDDDESELSLSVY